jgi:hypothetical protein
MGFFLSSWIWIPYPDLQTRLNPDPKLCLENLQGTVGEIKYNKCNLADLCSFNLIQNDSGSGVMIADITDTRKYCGVGNLLNVDPNFFKSSFL